MVLRSSPLLLLDIQITRDSVRSLGADPALFRPTSPTRAALCVRCIVLPIPSAMTTRSHPLAPFLPTVVTELLIAPTMSPIPPGPFRCSVVPCILLAVVVLPVTRT